MNLQTLLTLKVSANEVSGEFVPFKSTDKWLLVILWYMKRAGIPTSKQSIGRYALLSTTAVVQSLKTLEKLGLITKIQTMDSSGDYAPNTYTFNEAAIMACGE